MKRDSRLLVGCRFTYWTVRRLIKESTGLEYLYDESGIAGVIHNGATYLYRKNAQGDIIGLIDNTGNVVVNYVYDAWGAHKVYGADGSEITDAGHIGSLNPIRYRGYYYDTETKLYFLKTRYYDPELCRFVTIDDTAYLDPNAINGLNLYAYCLNNPVMCIDPNGNAWWEFWKWDWGKIILGALAVVGMAALSIVSFGIAAPLGAMVATGIAFGVGSGIISGISSGQSIGGIISNALTGGLIGGAMAFAIGLGMIGGAALAGGTAAAGLLSSAGLTGGGAFLLSTVAVASAQGLNYLIDASYNNKDMSIKGFLGNVAYGAVSGVGLFGIGGLMGFNGWGLKPALKLIDKAFYTAIQIIFKSFFKQGYNGVFGG